MQYLRHISGQFGQLGVEGPRISTLSHQNSPQWQTNRLTLIAYTLAKPRNPRTPKMCLALMQFFVSSTTKETAVYKARIRYVQIWLCRALIRGTFLLFDTELFLGYREDIRRDRNKLKGRNTALHRQDHKIYRIELGFDMETMLERVWNGIGRKSVDF
ncbi:hypothetical protein HUJ05_009896 [Dendroctonus ponderosae]|nr:hypothetical protein HUJ05_009896 [Dendroctonus ponderosae]